MMLASFILSLSVGVAGLEFNRPATFLAPPSAVLQGGTFLLVSGVAYCAYVGQPNRGETFTHVRFHVTTAGAGAQTAEVGIFSTPLPPNRTGQILTKLAASGTVDALTSTGIKGNSSTLAIATLPDVPLWGCVRTAMATTQPTIVGLARDQQDGHYLSVAAAGALTGVSTMTGAVAALATTTQAPNLRIYTQ